MSGSPPVLPFPSWPSARDKTPPPQPPPPSSSSDAAASNVNDFGHLPHTFNSSPLKNKTYVKTIYAGSQSPDIQKEKRDDIGTSVRNEVMGATFRNIPELVSVSFPDRAFNVTTDLSVEHVRYPEAEADVENNHANAESNEGASGDDELQSSMADGDATHVRDTSPPTPAPSTPATSPDGPRRSARLQHMASKVNLARDCIDPIKKVLEHLKGKCLYRDGEWVNWPVTSAPGAEPHIVTYFNKVVDEARSFLDPAYKKSSNDRVFSGRYSEIALNSTTAERKPDIVVLSREDAEREEKGSWAGVYGFGELKSNPTFPLNMSLSPEGVMVVKKDFNAPKYEGLDVSNLEDIIGVEYLREWLHLPQEIEPSTYKKQARPQRPAQSRDGAYRAPRGDRGDRDDYRRDKAKGAPGGFRSQFAGGYVHLRAILLDSSGELGFGSGAVRVFSHNACVAFGQGAGCTHSSLASRRCLPDPGRVVRLEFGKRGAAIAVRANLFTLKYPKDVVLYNYPVVITPDVVHRCGTLVDWDVTAVYNFDFFLQGHAKQQGTVRATHYTGAHDASYLWAAATTSVRLVPPA
ncbi:hypothetical protein DFH11DRAFT_1877501 [Phellopilus nigrolimitatus]|nr:hypothetical protein DFH11DRAFT_1877501 [Phellopilus nigrolimitatus]